jgi:FkbM family methyltransferase
VNGRQRIETLGAAIVGDRVSEVEFYSVTDKALHNSGGGSCVRNEPGSVKIRVPALWVVDLWDSKQISFCDVLKLDCEGSEVPILRALARAGLLRKVRRVVGEWHALSRHPRAGEDARAQLQSILQASHEIDFRQPLGGTEGHFAARLREGV